MNTIAAIREQYRKHLERALARGKDRAAHYYSTALENLDAVFTSSPTLA